MAIDQHIDWLMDGDVAIQYQCKRDLLGEDDRHLQARIATEGWGARFLSLRQPGGHWGRGFYVPKWISTHYTLLDLKNLAISKRTASIRETIDIILSEQRNVIASLHLSEGNTRSDICINGMFLNYACYFQHPQSDLHSIIDFLLKTQMPDGGWNCHLTRIGAVHSSLHSTLSNLEGLEEYETNGYDYRLDEVQSAVAQGREFILLHRLYKSDRTGEIIHPRFLRLPFPSRWFYDILRALDYFRASRTPFDERMQDAFDVLLSKRRKYGTWPLNARHAGEIHFEMEKAGQPSRWNTLRALRVFEHYFPGKL